MLRDLGNLLSLLPTLSLIKSGLYNRGRRAGCSRLSFIPLFIMELSRCKLCLTYFADSRELGVAVPTAEVESFVGVFNLLVSNANVVQGLGY